MNWLQRYRRVYATTLAVGLFFVTHACCGQLVESAGQTKTQIEKTLQSFKQLDEHPLFEMTYHGDYVADEPIKISMKSESWAANWACSIFVSFGKDGSAIYGRNFDWQHNPALLLHTNPSNGYASVSMVDISYLGFERKDEKYKTLEGRSSLLSAPLLPFDGMNEHGLTIGMAAVHDTELPNDKNKPTIGSLQIIRLMLDRAKNVEEALALFDQFNIDMRGGPVIHYLIGDAQRNSAVVELKDGEKHVLSKKQNWQSATNFCLTGTEHPLQQCPRFAKIERQMSDAKDGLSDAQAWKLLKNVAQRHTQWSVVYDMSARSADVTMSRNWNKFYKFKVKPDK